MNDRTRKAPPLLWVSDAGRVSCPQHVPTVGSPTWWSMGWAPMSDDARIGFARARGQEACCEACMAIATATALVASFPSGDGAGGVQ